MQQLLAFDGLLNDVWIRELEVNEPVVEVVFFTFRDQKIVEQIRSALGTKAAESEDSNNSKEAENV